MTKEAQRLPYQVLLVCLRCGLKGEADLAEEQLIRDPVHDTIRLVIWIPKSCPRCGEPVDWPTKAD